MGYQEIFIEVKNLSQVSEVVNIVEQSQDNASIIEVIKDKNEFKKGDKFIWVYGERHPLCDNLYNYAKFNNLKFINLDELMIKECMNLRKDIRYIDLPNFS